MRKLLFLVILICLGNALTAQYIYTIKADSVKITNNCDTAELIIENHTQNVPGFLFNKGRGRTEFRKALQKITDSMYLVGADTLKLLPSVYTAGIGLTESPLRTFNNNLLTGVSGGQTIIGSTSGNSGLEIRASNNSAPTTGADIRFTSGLNGAVENMRILNNGNVGIGTSLPDRKLVLRSTVSNEVGMSLKGPGGGDLLTLSTTPEANAALSVPTGGLNITTGNGIVLNAGGILTIATNGRIAVNELTPMYNFHVFEHTSGQTTSTRAGYFWNASHVNATAGDIITAGVYGQNTAIRESGSNNVINAGVYGYAEDAQDAYGGLFEVVSIDSFKSRSALQLLHTTSRQVVNGFGVGIQARAENSIQANVVCGNLDWSYSNVSSGNESADLSLKLINAGANAEKLRLRSNGELNIGDFTDRGAFTLQNTGAFYQNGGVNNKVSTINTNTTIDGTYHFIKIDASSGNVSIILPLANTVFVNNTGITYVFKRVDNTSNTVSILRGGSDTIDGGTSFTLTGQYAFKNCTATSSNEWSLH